MNRTVTGADTAISQLPSAQAATSRPSAADTEGFAEGLRLPEGLFEGDVERDADGWSAREGAPSVRSDPPQPATARAVSTASPGPAPA
ncbi:hypothetical protein [Streptomyces sp. PSAA01]|uniref:hypothetical protein n=1 Tax=Streptomyces sp. PSAA01 TaxID=2912762 RepID=UPI001F265A22|nr:hypothetical protein [Streptomyces sp. PSAA01]MCG0283489.1 hypothetical protein [Streptomyces sp. PSAA01]